MANALVEGVGDRLVGQEKGDVEVLLGCGDDAIHEGKSVDDGKEVCLDLKVILRHVDGNDKVRPLSGEELFD